MEPSGNLMKLYGTTGVLLVAGLALLGGCAHRATEGDRRRELDGQDAVIRELTRKNEDLAAREQVQTTEIETLRARVEMLERGGGSRQAVSELSGQLAKIESDVQRLGDELGAGLRESIVRGGGTLQSGELSEILGAGNQAFRSSERPDGLAIILADTLLFSAGSAELRPEGRDVLLQLASRLASTDYRVRVEGHTDDSPVRRSVDRYPLGNLQLSGDRALRVADFLSKNGGIAQSRISFAGYGEHHPLVPNDSAANRAKNRRVELILLKPRT